MHIGTFFYDKKRNYYEYVFYGLSERYSYIADEINFLMWTASLTESMNNVFVPKEIRVVSVINSKFQIGWTFIDYLLVREFPFIMQNNFQ